ncbi:aminomethyl-transferring glycine dehydrogenase [Moheibacter lacus]|uniref:glycine dehydrogenase (aminomethyl-transferring) n=1 Tax=Moheibacter lacus TaxID=2745851 RepID=A0A838ZKX8_9FLAO|nr:aminomethyl-transferring glycine dehydrogenase [Moheibacter lacus]MBA5628350.1 aminomethyl-transferring glycine dehydrogenase [Moheibacter lacus]
MNTQDFSLRHIGTLSNDAVEMLSEIGKESIDELINETMPAEIRFEQPLNLPSALSEYEILQHLEGLADKNIKARSFIGYGYYRTILPSPIQRNILENPGWYTAYTPYQAEIAQGRLEALLNYQTVVSDLTGLPIANASLLDEATACAEAMHMMNETKGKDKKEAHKFFIAEDIFPQSLAVCETKASGLGIEIVTGNPDDFDFTDEFYGALLQYPGKSGKVTDYTDLISDLKAKGIRVVVATDLMALVLLKSPGEMGADIAVGTSQRFGVPMGYGGPHAAFMSCTEDYKRQIPGRIIGVSQDRNGKFALRMALQTREQHIKRERATSNICTAQVLLAVMAAMYAVYHGKNGLENIAQTIHKKAVRLNDALNELGYKTIHDHFFDTIQIEAESVTKEQFEANHILLNFFEDGKISIAIDEVVSEEELEHLIGIFAEIKGKSIDKVEFKEAKIPSELVRTSEFLTNDVFKSYHTETELMRYIKRLERKDLALNHSMIALGSCTMKLNAATEMLPLSWSGFNSIHPFVPKSYALGYQEMIHNLENYLSEITGFAATSVQQNSGAQGEYAGLMVIRSYQIDQGEGHRNVVLIPESAHGTNPASAAMAGMKIVVVKNLPSGETDIDDLKAKIGIHRDNLSALMITYPSTYGAFDSNIKEVTKLVHEAGGQIYMDGANMNAQVGLTAPGMIGADVCHLNLHKTFAIPHGGGGPGVGPICVASHLAPYLGGHPLIETGGEKSDTVYSAAPYGSSLILLISYSYIRMLGEKGLTNSTKHAILNANYMKVKLEKYYDVLYTNAQNVVAHEFILDFRPFKKLGIEVSDIAKRLMDYGFHAPTVSFPVTGTLMIEPTESESKAELDRFVEALIQIKAEIDEVANGDFPQDDNVLKNAPHPLDIVTADDWNFPYSREKAAYPLEWVRDRKFFTPVARIDDAFGDRNLICTCPSVESYVTE